MTPTTDPGASAPTPAAPPPRRPSSRGRIVLGALLVLVGVVWFAAVAGLASLRWSLLVPGALVVVGIGLLSTARRGGHGGLVGVGIALAVAAVTLPAAAPAAGWSDVGQRTLRPTSVAELDEPVTLSVGSVTVDLRELDGDAPVRLDASVGLGELVVVLPAAAAAEVSASAGVGEATVVDRRGAGMGVDVDERLPGASAPWQLEVSTGIGRVEVRR